jgi:hypothetical protein
MVTTTKGMSMFGELVMGIALKAATPSTSSTVNNTSDGIGLRIDAPDMLNAIRVGLRSKASMFFSEEKNQKTFTSWLYYSLRPWPRTRAGRRK